MKNTILATLIAPALLVACGGGGGGGGSSSPAAPGGMSYGTPIAAYVVKVSIEANVPTISGQVTSWSVTPALPAGLSFDTATGTVSGTPGQETGRMEYLVTAFGPGGSTTGILDLEVLHPARFAYAAGADDTIGIYTIDAFDGGLRFHGLHHHEAPDAAAEQIAVHPNGRFLYVPNLGKSQSNSTVTAYSVHAGKGSLGLVGHAVIGEGPHRLAIHPNGRTLYGVSYSDHTIHVYSVNQLTGALTVKQVIGTNTGPERLSVDPLGRFLYVAHRPSADIAAFSIEADGSLTADIGGFNYYAFIPSDVEVDHAGTFAYFTFEVTDALASYSINPVSGELGGIKETPTTGKPAALRIHPKKRYAYVACSDTNTLDVFTLDPVHGGASLLETHATGLTPTAVEFDPSGRQLYVLSEDSNEVRSFAADQKTGLLTPLDTVRTRTEAVHFGFQRGEKPAQPREEFLYVVNSDSDDVAGFSIDASSGLLTSSGSSLTGQNPADVAVDPLGRYIWVANVADSSISIFKITPGTGELVPSGLPYQLGVDPGGLSVDPAGDYLYVSLPEDDEIVGLRILANGDLTEVDRTSFGDGPTSVSIDPTGQFLCVSNLGSVPHTVSAIRVLKGEFLATTPEAAAPGHPGRLSFAPDGMHAYVALAGSKLIVPYSIDADTGALTIQVAGSIAVDTAPSAVSLTPDGRFAFAAVPGNVNQNGYVAAFAIDESNGKLSAAGTFIDGMSPVDLEVGPTSRYLYVANGQGDDLTVFTIDADSGSLTVLSNTPAGLKPEALILAIKVD